MHPGQFIAFLTLLSMALLGLVLLAHPSRVTSSERQAGAVGWLSVVLLALLLVGCKTAPSPDAGPLQSDTVAAAVLCEDPPLLIVPTGTNSAQLEQILYAAYLELRAIIQQCRTDTATHKEVRP